MQTFLPYADYYRCASCLDYKRLGKQRVEVLQILDTNIRHKKPWSKHPAVIMWSDYLYSLTEYGIIICQEWIALGYKDTCLDKILMFREQLSVSNKEPHWLGNPALHSSHRAALLYKDYDWYSQFEWSETPLINYYWPIENYKS